MTATTSAARVTSTRIDPSAPPRGAYAEGLLPRLAAIAGPDRTLSFGVSLLTEVADAARDAHPDAAIALYEECAHRLIADRGRSNYRTAADLLVKARDLYEKRDGLDTWQSFINALYDDELHRLTAARDEFEKRDLL